MTQPNTEGKLREAIRTLSDLLFRVHISSHVSPLNPPSSCTICADANKALELITLPTTRQDGNETFKASASESLTIHKSGDKQCRIREHNGLERLLLPGPYLPNPELGQDVAFIAIKLDSLKEALDAKDGIIESLKRRLKKYEG